MRKFARRFAAENQSRTKPDEYPSDFEVWRELTLMFADCDLAGLGLDKLPLRLCLSATDLSTGETVVFSSGPIGPSLRATKCANHDHPDTVNVCGPALPNIPIAVYEQVDSMTCASGWRCLLNDSVTAQNSMDALTCEATKYPPSSYTLVANAPCSTGVCK